MLTLPRILGVEELRTVSFYDYRALTQCRLKACMKRLRLLGALPPPIPSRHALLGRFHHELMRHAVSLTSSAELERQIESEVRRLQEEVDRWPHLRGLGSVSGWDEVNASAAVAMSTLVSGRRGASGAIVAAECGLRSTDGTRSGRPDYFEINGHSARLREYKAGEIRDRTGQVREEYELQLLFYAGLLIERYRVERVLAQLQSLGGDRVEREITPASARDFSERVVAAMEAANEQVRSTKSIEDLAQPSAIACEDCSLRILCAAFKRTQATLGLPAERYILEGRVIKQQLSASGRSVELSLEEAPTTQAPSAKISGISVPTEAAAGLQEGKVVVLSDLRRHAGALCWGKQSRIFLHE